MTNTKTTLAALLFLLLGACAVATPPVKSPTSKAAIATMEIGK